jgi:hypothetical protein
MYSVEYGKHLQKGPFPGGIDPWSEIGYYFQQIHAAMITHLVEQLQQPLVLMGYKTVREASLLVGESREPDIWFTSKKKQPEKKWDYTSEAETIHAEPGIVADGVDLAAIHIKWHETGQLVTVVEVVSPSNKSERHNVSAYREYRHRLLEQGVNVVEIDPTRSFQRLFEHRFTQIYPYHIAVHLPENGTHIIGNYFDQPLKRFALPLRREVIAVETHTAYEAAYQGQGIANQIQDDGNYTDEKLPFPSSLTPQERQKVLEQVKQWREKLTDLQQETK